MNKLFSFLFFLLSCSAIPTRYDAANYTPFQDDELAFRYRPFLKESADDRPEKLLYRASKDSEGMIYLAYHFIWSGEENTSTGFMPFLSRNIYTGGLSLQASLYGKGDIELIALKISPDGQILELNYETADQYSASDFSVKHKTIVEKETLQLPLQFEVISWNHLFKRIDTSGDKFSLKPEYFSEDLWQEYEMVKPKETFYSRHRAHKLYERQSVGSK